MGQVPTILLTNRFSVLSVMTVSITPTDFAYEGLFPGTHFRPDLLENLFIFKSLLLRIELTILTWHT